MNKKSGGPIDKYFWGKYFPHENSFIEQIRNGFAPKTAGEAEAIRRYVIRDEYRPHRLQSLEGEAEAIRRYVLKDWRERDELKTWLWNTDRIEEMMSEPPLTTPRGCPLRITPNIGIGFHLFKKTDKYKKEYYASYPDNLNGDGIPLLPRVLLIRHQCVEVIDCDELSNDGAGWSFRSISADDPYYLLACRMVNYLKHKVVEIETVPALGRQERKREGLVSSESKSKIEVNIVTWRKPANNSRKGSSDGSQRENCWWVSGHERLQPYPSKGFSKLIWIDQHLRGNKDAPLKIRKPVVNVVSR